MQILYENTGTIIDNAINPVFLHIPFDSDPDKKDRRSGVPTLGVPAPGSGWQCAWAVAGWRAVGGRCVASGRPQGSSGGRRAGRRRVGLGAT